MRDEEVKEGMTDQNCDTGWRRHRKKEEKWMAFAAGDVGGKAGMVLLHLEPCLSFSRQMALLGSEGQKEVKNIRDNAKRLIVSCKHLL